MSFFLLYGKPGSGKTTMSSTMTKLGLTVHYLDVDNKIPQMSNLSALLSSGKITYTPIQSKLLKGTLKMKLKSPEVVLSKQPDGYYEIVNFIDSLEEARDKGEAPPADVLVLDSLTSAIEHLKRLLMYLSKPKMDKALTPKLEFDHWNALLANLEELFVTLAGLTNWFKHIIIICHQQSEVEKQGDNFVITDILPAIEGSMRQKVGKYFPEVYHLEAKQSGSDVKYQILTKPVNKYMARTSMSLDTKEEADFSIILKKGLNNG
jgi:hypothetical protein